jgi:hypothetical protein
MFAVPVPLTLDHVPPETVLVSVVVVPVHTVAAPEIGAGPLFTVNVRVDDAVPHALLKV